VSVLTKRRSVVPTDPTAPVLARTITTAGPVMSAWWMPGVWTGSGCETAQVHEGDPANDDALEGLVRVCGGYDVVIAEPIELMRALVKYGRDRDETWFAAFVSYARDLLPGALDDIWRHDGVGLRMEHVRYLGALYAHPISCCWPVDADRYHMHGIVVGQVYCSDPSCTELH
jgi:hypothetical protein